MGLEHQWTYTDPTYCNRFGKARNAGHNCWQLARSCSIQSAESRERELGRAAPMAKLTPLTWVDCGAAQRRTLEIFHRFGEASNKCSLSYVGQPALDEMDVVSTDLNRLWREDNHSYLRKSAV